MKLEYRIKSISQGLHLLLCVVSISYTELPHVTHWQIVSYSASEYCHFIPLAGKASGEGCYFQIYLINALKIDGLTHTVAFFVSKQHLVSRTYLI